MVPTAIRRVVITQHRVDFRKQMTGLLAEAYRLGADPYQGDCVVFVKADQTQLRALLRLETEGAEIRVRGTFEYHGQEHNHGRAIASIGGGNIHTAPACTAVQHWPQSGAGSRIASRITCVGGQE